ncbi:quinohemoprotein amine dehydrogenase subunit alpha [Aneurinibacillus aneurinilyticus]|uniref:Quinohemoprotein amine dehydrogenase subunit alpha n=1 Tax=Aneurinibacillus aneurinilyticus TaxID=1391 RepID=A0A848D0M0_ANEAE|nr:quinohemoprotein amine dehydrogenase subunit alpha [Aneurinibacillus aneurinilyticus]NME99617.1 quinohemoprotein amine dehydrogenase subunit alpha [Aneurinibacillus aneurinilyticus]
MKENRIRLLLLGLIAVSAIIFFALYWNGQGNQTRETAAIPPSAGGTHVSKQVEASCMGCHAVDENGKLARIEYMRKTPEGWSQTIARMERLHGLKVTDEQRKQLIQDLSNERGLSLEEAQSVQYWLAEKPSHMEDQIKNPNLQNACMTCHAGGRFMAQRRTEEEWKNLKDFHLVMFPSIYLNHRHTDWPVVADAAINYLAKQYPLENKEWENWKGKNQQVDGKWKVVGFQGTKGAYVGDSEFMSTDGKLTEKKSVRYLDQNVSLQSTGNVEMYSGYALRMQYEQAGKKLRGTFNVGRDGKTITGDWSDASNPGITGEETYYKVQTEKPEIIHMEPRAIQRGQTQDLTLYGMNVKQLTAQDLKLPAGVSLKNMFVLSDDQVKISLAVDDAALTGASIIGTEKAIVHPKLVVYDRIDYIKVTPPYAVARVGGAELMHKVSTQFVAYAYSSGKDGKQGTDDDIELMPVTAEWALAPYPEGEKDEDLHYIGSIDSKTGLFTPAAEGVNKERPFTQENVGSVSVIAKYRYGGNTLTGKTHLVVTVPDYNNVIN